jgi:hypothetical protein
LVDLRNKSTVSIHDNLFGLILSDNAKHNAGSPVDPNVSATPKMVNTHAHIDRCRSRDLRFAVVAMDKNSSV